MPGGDRTGPVGAGSMTGRGAGYCAGHSVPGYMNPVGSSLGRWAVWGHGRGYRHWYRATGVPGWGRANYGPPAWGAHRFPYFYAPQPSVTPKEEIEMLKAESEGLEQALKEIRKRMEELEKVGSKG